MARRPDSLESEFDRELGETAIYNWFVPNGIRMERAMSTAEGNLPNSLALPLAAKAVVDKIRHLIFTNRAAQALPLVYELDKYAQARPTAVALAQGVCLADIAEETDDAECARRAVSTMERVNASSLPEAAKCQHWYNLGNAHSTSFRIKRIAPGIRRALDSNLIEAKAAYQRSIARSADVGRESRARLHTNYGHLLRRLGRYVEAIESFDQALTQVPDFGMALWGKGTCMSWYSTLVQPPYKRTALVEAWKLWTLSIEKGVEPGKDAKVRDELHRLEKALHGPPDLTHAHAEHRADSEIEARYIRFCVENRLYLHPCPLESHEAYLDPLAVRFSIPGTDQAFELISENLSELKREYASARFLLFAYKENWPDLRFVDRGLFLPSLDAREGSMHQQLLNLAFRSAYSILDKIAYHLNNYCRLRIKPERISFNDRLFLERGALRAGLSGYDGLQLAALYDLSRELSLGEALCKLRNLRNKLEHRLGVLSCAEPPEKAEQIRAIADRTSSERSSVTESELYSETFQLIRAVRAAIFYLFWFVQKTAAPPKPDRA